MRTLALILCCLSLAVPAQAARQVGQADFTFLWFDLYRATLFHPSGHFSFEKLEGTRLVLEYKINIKAGELVKGTKKEWQKLGLEISQERAAWLAQLKAIWPNIEKGDQLAFDVLPEGIGRFSLSQQGKTFEIIGTLKSSNFNNDFLAIWLAERKAHKEFRLTLLGHQE